MKEKIRLLTLFSVLFGCALHSAHALPPAPSDCDISTSTPQLDYGDITSSKMYSEGTQKNDGTISLEDKEFTLTVTCQKPRFITIELSADKTAGEYYFDANHGAKIAISIEKITTNNNSHNIKFWPRFSSNFENYNSHEWGPGYVLATTHVPSTQMNIEMKVKLILPEAIRKTRSTLDIGTDLKFTLGGNVNNMISSYRQDERESEEFFGS